MNICKDDQIKNPITNRCVLIKGVTGKMLIKKYINGDINLAPENVKKITNVVKTPINTVKTPINTVKTPINTVKTPINTVKTPINTVKTPINTVKTSINTVKTPTKSIVNNTPTTNKKITFKKMSNIKKNTSFKLPVNNTPLNKNEVTKQVKDKIHNFVIDWKKKKDKEITDRDYENYCKTKKNEDIKKPIVNISLNIDFPVATMSMSKNSFTSKYLNLDKQQFVYNKITGIQIAFNNYSLRNLLYKGANDTIKYFEDLVDKTWLNQMNKYISELSTKELYTLVAYTHYGDTIANNFLRNKLVKDDFIKNLQYADKWYTNYYPLFFQALDILEKTKDIKAILKDGNDVNINILPPNISTSFTLNKNKGFATGIMPVSVFLKKIFMSKNLKISDKYDALYLSARFFDYDKFWKNVIQQYINDLDDLINKSPSISKKMIVYRGVKNDYFLNGTKNNIYKTDSFVSTSINLPSAMKFADSYCCFKRITLLPGTKALLMAGISKYKNEIELLLGTKSQFYITKSLSTIPRSTTELCNDSKIGNIKVTDMVIVK